MRNRHRPFALLAFLLSHIATYAQLTADFTMDRSNGCSPLSINFTSITNGSSASATYSWNFGNGNSSSLRNPSAIFTKEQTYTITLVVTDGSHTATSSKTLTVYKKPVVEFSVGAPKVCLPATAIFSSGSTAGDGAISSLQWDFGDGIVQQESGSTVSHSYSTEQVATVSLTVTNNFGCQASATKKDIVEILGPITPVFTANKSLLCAITDTVAFTNNSKGPGALRYSWDFGDGITSTLTNPAHRFATKAVYPVKLTVSNEVGCSAVSYPVPVNAAYFQTDFTSRPLCREVSFSPSSFVYPSSSFWKFGDGATSFSSYNPSHIYGMSGTYQVTLVNTYGACRDTVSKTVSVSETANYNSGITGPGSTCQRTYVNFTSTSNTAPGLITWDFGDGNIHNYGNYPMVSHAYSHPGTYTVKMTNVFGTCSETVTKTIVVNPLPEPTGFMVDYGGVCGAPVTVKFSDTTSGVTAWQWHLDYTTNNSFSTAKQASYNFGTDGYYRVHLTVQTAAGCTATTTKQVNVFRPLATIGYTQSSSPRGNYDCDSLRIRFIANGNQTIRSYNWNLGNGTTSTEAQPEAFYDKEGIYPVSLTYVTESGCTASASYSVRVYGKPKANFTYHVPCGNSLSIQFNDVSYFSDRWQWQVVNGGNDFFFHHIHNFPDTGLYSVKFVSHIGRCSDTIVKTVHANLLPSSVFISKAENTCTGNRATLRFDHQTVRATGHVWNFGDGTTLSADSSNHHISHTYKASGTYTVTLTARYGTCVHTHSREVRVLLKQSPLLTANKTQICASDNLGIQISNLQNNPFGYNSPWGHYSVNKIEYNTGETYSGISNYYDWNYTSYNTTLSNFEAGVSKMRVIINSGQPGCTDTTNFVDLQVNGPVAKFGVQSKDLCFKSPFVFTDSSRSVTSTALSSWFWEFGDGTSQMNTTKASVRHTYARPGTYQVRLRVTDATGCHTSFTILVNARGTKAAFTPAGLFIPNVPLNTTITFYNNSSSFASNPGFLWNYGNGASGTTFYGSHTYTVAGTTKVELIASDPDIPCADTASTIITVKDFNTAFTFSKSFLGGGSCPPVLLRINNLSVGFTSLKWDFGDGTTSTSSYYPSHIYNQPGVYKITLYTFGYNGLTGTYVDSIEVRQPVATINANTFHGCLSQNIKLQAASQNATTYLWDFGDGQVSTTPSVPVHAYHTAGLYTPRLIIKDAAGCAASADLAERIVIDSLSVKIGELPAVLCDSALVDFRSVVGSFAAANLGTSLRYNWNFGTGNAGDTSGLANPSFRFTKPGTYLVRLSVSSPFGCSRQSTISVVVTEKAKGRITAVPQTCQDTRVKFLANTSTTAGVLWAWNFGNGNNSSELAPPEQLYTTPGIYPVTLLLTKNGCIDTVVHTLTVHPKPVTNARPKQQVLCLGNTNTLAADGGGSYQWSPAAGLSNTTIANPVASPVVTTSYRVLVTTENGCTSSDSLIITVAQPVKVQLPQALEVCKGSSVQLTASGASSYQWISFVNGLSNTAIAGPVATPPSTATYTVTGSDLNNCFKDTARVTITVRNLPTVNAGPDLQLAGNAPYQLNAGGSNDIVSWQWSPASDLSCADCPSPLLMPKMETQYILTVRNQWGCTAKDTMLVKLDCAADQVYFPDAITPNNDGRNDIFFIMGAGIKLVKHLRVYSRWGDIVFERNNFAINDRSAGWNGQVKGHPVESGTYVYVAEMECSSGLIFSRRGTVTVVR